jgi:nucleotide-binding universal stress UspA family protein
MRLQRILVPIDFSGSADRAVDLALTIAGAVDGRVTLLYVFSAPATVLPDGSTFAATPSELLDVSARAEQAVADARRDLERRAGGVAIAAETRMGRAADEILRLAQSGEFDLVVMGTHGRTGLGRLLLGSVAESVMRRSPIPVLTVRIVPGEAHPVVAAHGPAVQ